MDYDVFSLFDGHGGTRVSEYLKNNFNKKIMENLKSFKDPV